MPTSNPNDCGLDDDVHSNATSSCRFDESTSHSNANTGHAWSMAKEGDAEKNIIQRGSIMTDGGRICQMPTFAGAEAVEREKETGSIEIGKKANFIAVSEDLSMDNLDKARILRTWFEGEIVYEEH
ncbi:hypothetical protein PV11_00046 [Exophiala sideris]|uniref:Amidohydrolase-related domain-containing protein n=1 Tax=Exophiala sideris TaxID=1016849 RepID=A0A0D1X8V3_9EURO|nr:hypothetical protein PV11_00046 [Exophiala sideris]